MAAQLWLGPDWFVSHRAAAKLWALDGAPRGLLEFSGPTARPSHNGVYLHRTTQVPPGEVVTRQGFRVSGASRTLVDLGCVLPADDVEAAMESALRAGLTSIDYLARTLERHRAPGRNGAGVLARILELRPPDMPPTDSPFETRLYQALRRYGLPRPQRQFWICDGDRKLGRVDFAYPEQMTVIEADSYKHHSSRLDWDSDIDRYNTLTSLGWAVLRITWRRLRDHPEEAMRKIARTIGYARFNV